MGAIKDITDLTIKLLESKEARKFSGEILKIQSLAAALQSEQAGIVEKNTELLSENFALKQKIAELQKAHGEEVAALNESHRDTVTNSQAHSDLGENEIKILVLLSHQDDPLEASSIGSQLGLSTTKAQYLADTLVSGGYLHDLIFFGSPKQYTLKHGGREYLVKHDLV